MSCELNFRSASQGLYTRGSAPSPSNWSCYRWILPLLGRVEARRRVKKLLLDDDVSGEDFTQLGSERRQCERLLQENRAGLEHALMHDRLVGIP